MTSENSIEWYIHMLRDNLWVDRKFQFSRPIRTPKEKSKSKTEASLMLATLVPGTLAKLKTHVHGYAFTNSHLRHGC